MQVEPQKYVAECHQLEKQPFMSKNEGCDPCKTLVDCKTEALTVNIKGETDFVLEVLRFLYPPLPVIDSLN